MSTVHTDPAFRAEERAAILKAVGDFRGSFVSIGANDGILGEPTWPLVQAGWRGIMVEPNPWAFCKLYENLKPHPNVTLACMAWYPIDGVVAFYPHANDRLSTTNSERYQSKNQGYQQKMLSGRWRWHHYHATDFVSIDIEGNSAACMLDMLSCAICPRWLVIEHQGEDRAQIEEYANDWQYKILHETPENLFMERQL